MNINLIIAGHVFKEINMYMFMLEPEHLTYIRGERTESDFMVRHIVWQGIMSRYIKGRVRIFHVSYPPTRL